MINDQVVGKVKYNPAKSNFIDTIRITIPKSIPTGPAVLKILASDILGFSNTASETITLLAQDTKAPVVQNKRVIKRDDGTYEVRLFIVDNESFVVSGWVRREETVLMPITNSVVSFSTPTLGQFLVTAVDYYGNTMQETIDLHP